MNRIHIELIPAIGGRLIDLGISALYDGTHNLRRLTEGFVWGGHDCRGNHSGHCGGCQQVHHHYRYSCQPRCYDCRR